MSKNPLSGKFACKSLQVIQFPLFNHQVHHHSSARPVYVDRWQKACSVLHNDDYHANTGVCEAQMVKITG